MKLIFSRQCIYDSPSGKYYVWPYYVGVGIWGGKLVPVSTLDTDLDIVPKNLGIAYYNWSLDAFAMYPKPLNLLFRLINYTRERVGYPILRTFYWVGLIDTGEAEAFYWDAFYRIKSKH